MSSVRSIQLIAIERISIPNPRVKTKRAFRGLVESIAKLGLKRPITVTQNGADHTQFQLVCGQGRLQAFIELGQASIPAVVIQATPEEAIIKSLVENCVRRQELYVEPFRDIRNLMQREYSNEDIAKKTGLSLEYVGGVVYLIKRDEQRLLRAIERHQLPVSVLVEIAKVNDTQILDVLSKAKNAKLVRGRKLLLLKRIVKTRALRGKRLRKKKDRPRGFTGAAVRAYRSRMEEKRRLVKKARETDEHLTSIVRAMSELFRDEKLVALLRRDRLDIAPTIVLKQRSAA
jgi:ParB family transcriptional regulator, chromosome partitioning protein